MSRRHVLAAALIPFTLAACAAVSVGSHLAREADFSSYRTFAWSAADPLPTGDPRLDNNPFFKDSLQGAVERHLAGHRIVLAAGGTQPDLLVHYHVAVTQRVDADNAHRGSVETGSGYLEPQVVTYDESTLVLDMIDAHTQRLVWRGWAQDDLRAVINDQARLKEHIEEAVTRMLELLPS